MNSGLAANETPNQNRAQVTLALKLRGEPSRGSLKGKVNPDPTPQEREIIKLRASGKVNKEIAEILGITVPTIESHMNNIYRRMGWNSLIELVHWALNEGITANKFAKHTTPIEAFFSANLGRKFPVSAVIETFGKDTRDMIRQLNCNEARRVTILTEGGYFWALEA